MTWETPAERQGSAIRATPACANCKMPIDHQPYEKGGRTFCCDGCAYGGPCVC